MYIEVPLEMSGMIVENSSLRGVCQRRIKTHRNKTYGDQVAVTPHDKRTIWMHASEFTGPGNIAKFKEMYLPVEKLQKSGFIEVPEGCRNAVAQAQVGNEDSLGRIWKREGRVWKELGVVDNVGTADWSRLAGRTIHEITQRPAIDGQSVLQRP